MSLKEKGDERPGARRAVFRWLDERLRLSFVLEAIRAKTVPSHRYSFIYFFGGMALFLLVIQLVTGVLLTLYYKPSADVAFESVEQIMTTVPFGWLVRSIHSWAANLLVFVAFAHLVSVYLAKAYRPPREITWISGCILLFLLMGFGFSGYLLPWNELAFFATKVGTQIAGSVPLIGEWIVRLLRGGDRVTGATLSRFYAVHVAILPAATALLLGLHLLLVQLQGMSVPRGAEAEASRRRPMLFVPHYLLRDAFGWVLALGVLAGLAALFPWELGEEADAFAPAPPDIRPEWYFMFMFQTLKLVPGGSVMGVELETVPVLGFGLAGLVLIAIPFLDRRAMRGLPSPGFTLAGLVVLALMIALTAWGYHSWAPVYAVVGALAVTLILAVAVRQREEGSR
jgi:cytochrome b6